MAISRPPTRRGRRWVEARWVKAAVPRNRVPKIPTQATALGEAPHRGIQWPTYGRLGEEAGAQPRGCHPFHKDSRGCGCVYAAGARLEAAGVLLGTDFDDCDPALYRQSLDTSLATLCGDGFGRGNGRADRQLLSAELDGLWRRHFCLRDPQRGLALGRRLPFCRNNAEYRSADRSCGSAMENRAPPIRRSVVGNCGSTGYNAGVENSKD